MYYKATILNQYGPTYEKYIRQNTKSRSEPRSSHLGNDDDYISSEWRGRQILNKWYWFGYSKRSKFKYFPYTNIVYIYQD